MTQMTRSHSVHSKFPLLLLVLHAGLEESLDLLLVLLVLLASVGTFLGEADLLSWLLPVTEPPVVSVSPFDFFFGERGLSPLSACLL